MKRGELYRVHKPNADPKRHRVFVIVSRQSVLNSAFSSVICAPVFSHGEGLTTQVSIGIGEGLKHESWIMCDGLTCIGKSELTQFVGSLSQAKIRALNRALSVALAIENGLDNH
jgi:mRNA interferase MazF